MNNNHLIQCKKVILNNKKYNGYIQLTLADKLYLRCLSRKVKKDKGINNITFEEFVLLCKHMKKEVLLVVKDNHCTRIVNLLNFDTNTLRYMMINILRDIEDKKKFTNIHLDITDDPWWNDPYYTKD